MDTKKDQSRESESSDGKQISTFKLGQFFRGWFVGGFSPTAFYTTDVEVGVVKHPMGSIWPAHRHNQSDEINVLLDGLMKVNGKLIRREDGFWVPKGVACYPTFLRDCRVLVIKIPSVPTDKEIVC